MKLHFLSRLFLVVSFLLVSIRPVTSVNAQNHDSEWFMTGQMGGITQALMQEGNTLYLGMGLHVEVLDVSDPKAITHLGSSPLLPEFIESISSDGKGHLYVACGSGGLQILDVSNPSAPVILGSYDTRGFTEGVALFNQYVVLADGPQGVQILDVSNPKSPRYVAEAYPLAYTYDVVVNGNVAYAAAGGSGLLVIDLSNPKAPVENNLIKLDGFYYDLALAGGKLYAAGAWGGVAMLDLASPFSPVVSNQIETSGWAMALYVQDSSLLVMDGADGAMLYDITGTTLKQKSSFTMGGFVLAGTLSGKNAFVMDKEKGLLSIDFSSAANPKLSSRWMPILDGRRVTISGTTGYISGGLSGMHVIDLSNPNNPVETFWYDTEGGYANKVIVADKTAYLSSHLATDTPLLIFDVSDPLKPVKVGAVPNDEAVFNTAFRSITLNNGYIYVPGEFYDMAVDVRNPGSPKVVSKIPMGNPVNADSSGNLLITTSDQMHLVDISDPTNIQLITTMDKHSSGEAIKFIDETTVITSGDAGIWIVDVSNPSSPRKLAQLAISGTVMDITIEGTTAYLSTLGNGIQIVDITIPTKPALVGSVATLGMAYDCSVKGNLMLVADSFSGLTVYQRKLTSQADHGLSLVRWADPASPQPVILTGLKVDNPRIVSRGDAKNNTSQKALLSPSTCVVSSTADDGVGTLRACLTNLKNNTTIIFDAAVFPPKKSATIQLKSALPGIDASYLTIDASNAGVILDGSLLESGNGLAINSTHNKIMGLQILNFPEIGIDVNGEENQIGGNRNNGTALLGEGNLTSGNQLYGMRIGGDGHLIIGNLVGTDVTGSKAVPNYDGIFVVESTNVTIGSSSPGEGNVISGNEFINLDTWGDHTRIIGNLIGLDITGKIALNSNTSSNLVMESGVMNAVVGGITPEERNIISGAQLGVVFSDPNSYQNTLIGNYIGTDISGTKAIPNQTGVALWTSGNHRVGGTLPGERNLISGNQQGISLNGYGVSDNIIIGNWIGVDASGEKALPNDTGIAINMGQRHAVIGGFTQEEGNLISGGTIALRISNPGIKENFIAGNTIANTSVAGVYFEDYSSNNFVQGNTFGNLKSPAVRVDYGSGNQIRGNSFMGKPESLIELEENGNLGLAAPEVISATSFSVKGTACANCLVEVYRIDKTQLTSAGFATTGGDGSFNFSTCQTLDGSQVVLLATDGAGNTSGFSKPLAVKAEEGEIPSSCPTT